MLRRKSWEWRTKELKFAFEYLAGSYSNPYLKELNPSFIDRIRYFLGTLRILIPLPSRYTKLWGLNFTYGLKCIHKDEKEKIFKIGYQGLKYIIPYEAYKDFIKILKGMTLYEHYQSFPVIINKGDIVIDCGAHIGIFSLLFAKLAGENGKVVAIEPEERNYQALVKMIELNKNVAPIIPLKVAVYKEDCYLDLYIAKKSGSHTIAPYFNERKDVLLDKKEKVRALKIDTIVFEELGLEKVDFIKMDMEGTEIDALLGAEQTIKRFKPKLAICSYHRPTDSEEIRNIILSYNPNYKIKEIEQGEKVLFAWDRE
uniref:FkbM family methyltransferase n=1 Tax=Thermodesulfobacterium geofontis TaxID=1295609 RepID=A0A7V6CDD9_9BACT